MKKNKISKILYSIVIVGIVLTLLALLVTPPVITAYFKRFQILSTENNVVTITYACIYICALPYVIALFKLKDISKFVKNNNPFSIENIKSLKSIAICTFTEVILFIGCVVYVKNFTGFYSEFFYLPISYIAPIFLVSFIAIFIGFLCLILANLLETAIEIKDENDKTI